MAGASRLARRRRELSPRSGAARRQCRDTGHLASPPHLAQRGSTSRATPRPYAAPCLARRRRLVSPRPAATARLARRQRHAFRAAAPRLAQEADSCPAGVTPFARPGKGRHPSRARVSLLGEARRCRPKGMALPPGKACCSRWARRDEAPPPSEAWRSVRARRGARGGAPLGEVRRRGEVPGVAALSPGGAAAGREFAPPPGEARCPRHV